MSPVEQLFRDLPESSHHSISLQSTDLDNTINGSVLDEEKQSPDGTSDRNLLVEWDDGDNDPLNPRSAVILRKWLYVIVGCMGSMLMYVCSSSLQAPQTDFSKNGIKLNVCFDIYANHEGIPLLRRGGHPWSIPLRGRTCTRSYSVESFK